MNNRNNDIISIRPLIKKQKISENMSDDERFQNTTLRPILKLQNPILLAAFVDYVNKHKGVFYELSIEKQLDYIEIAIYKDQKFRNSLKGILIGLFTLKEFSHYIQNSSILNKRMMNLVIKRLKDQLQLLVKN